MGTNASPFQTRLTRFRQALVGWEGPGSLASCNTRKLKCILINHMATENENYTLKNNNDNDNDIVTRLDLQASVLTMRPPRLQETNKRNS